MEKLIQTVRQSYDVVLDHTEYMVLPIQLRNFEQMNLIEPGGSRFLD